MKLIITESQLKKVLLEQQTPNLSAGEQTLLGFLSRFLRGEDSENGDHLPFDEIKKNAIFNTNVVYPMVQKLLEKKRAGTKTYDQKEFNALFMAMSKWVDKEQLFEFYKEGGKITDVQYHAQY